MNKRTRERASEPEGKGGKNSAQSKSSANELSFYQAVVRQRDTCQEKLNELEEELHAREEELDTCQAERDALKLKESLPEYLYVQQADKCVVKRGEEVGQFILESSAFLDVTERFTSKPLRFESSLSTDEWFASRFNNIFGESSPNAAMAMVDEGESTGTVVAVYSSAYPGIINQDGETVYAYKMYQSPDQASIASLEALLGDADEVTIDFCSMFIDDSSGTPCWTNEVCQSENRLSYCHFDFDNCPPEANTCGKCKPYNTQCEKGSGDGIMYYDKIGDIDRTQPFTLCFQAYTDDSYATLKEDQEPCWSEAYYDVKTGRFEACQPQGYWSAVEGTDVQWFCGGAGAACDTFWPPEPKRCCAPASGTFDRLIHVCYQGWQGGTNEFSGCIAGKYCWSMPWYDDEKRSHSPCEPKGIGSVWNTACDPLPADGGCGLPCEEFKDTPPLC